MNNNQKLFLNMVAASVLGGAIALGGYKLVEEKNTNYQSLEQKQQVMLSKYAPDGSKYLVPDGLNFMKAAEKATPGVVHIKTYYDGKASEYGRYSMEDLLKDFFGDTGPGGTDGENMERMATGSGVIITADGYIATNNHVVEDASKIEVVLNDKRSYIAKVIGTDPSTDLALLKIEENGLVFLPYGNSDQVKIGQWVLAVGNPFDLTSTVTAGIVSAKARSINILRGKSRLSVESFIQTDAAVNPGNSGGALIDLEGNLIGINTAIASNTGSYAGYSFAVPVSLAKKVMEDLLKYGEVRRALMGVNIQEIDAQLAKQKGFGDVKGVYIAGIDPSGGAAAAGIKEGDVILSIDGQAVNSVSELQEMVARHRPDEAIQVEYHRNGKNQQTKIVLKGSQAEEPTARIMDEGYDDSDAEVIEELGGTFAPVSEDERYALDIEQGVKVLSIEPGKLREAGVSAGFVITKVDKQAVGTPKALQEAIKGASGGVLLEGYTTRGEHQFYGLGF